MGKGKLPKKILRKVIDLLQAVYFSIFLVIAMAEFDDQILVDEYLVGIYDDYMMIQAYMSCFFPLTSNMRVYKRYI